MALHIKHYPEDYRTVYNPIETVLFETNTTPRGYTGFAYLIDVYRGTAAAENLIGRLKVPPTTDGYGRFDLSGIMESYLSSNLGTLNGSNISPYTIASNNYQSFVMKYGWLHYNGGTVTIDMDQTVTLPDSSTDSSTSLITLNGSLPNYRRDVVNFYDWQTTNYYSKYIPTYFAFSESLNTKKFLTNSPNYLGTYDLTFKPTSFSDKNQKVRLSDEGYIYSLASTDIKYVNYIIKDGSSISVKRFSVGSIVSSIKEIQIPSAPATINAIDPSDLQSGSQPIITSTTTDYSIYLTKTGSSDYMTEYFSFKLDTDCRYETRRLEFLNSLGGFDYYNFTKVSRHSEDIERKFLKANPSDLNTSTGAIEYSISNREKIQYYTKSSSKMKLNSDWVDAKTFNWLLELIESPEVYLLDDYTTPTGTTEVRRIPIKNIEGNWEEKISSTDNIFNLSIDLEFSMDNYRQRF